jgi:hypothetical protein
LSKFVGETEKNVRDLFADAENEQKARGMVSKKILSIMLFLFSFILFISNNLPSFRYR